MAIEYRLMRAEDKRAVLSLWSEVYGYTYEEQATRFASDPAAQRHTYVAVAADGTVLSTLHYRLSRRRDATGAPRLVGEVDSVTTRADARRQGHATRLLRMALDALRRDGCDWSLLVATEDGRPLYERYGWRCYGEPWRRGTILGELPRTTGAFVVRPYDPLSASEGWDPIAAVDVAFNRRRPLTVVRNAAYWRGYAALRVGTWIATEGLVIFAAFRGAADPRALGYAMAEFYPDAFQVRDIGALPEEAGVPLALLTAIAAEARRRGIPLAGRMYLPQEPPIDAALDRLFGPTLHAGQDDGHLMARPIASGFTEQQLDAIFTAPDAHFSAIDLF